MRSRHGKIRVGREPVATTSGAAAPTNAGQRDSPRHAGGNRTVRSLCGAYTGETSFYIKINWPFLGAGVVLPKLYYYFTKLALCQCSLPLIC